MAEDPAETLARARMGPDPWQAEALRRPGRQTLMLCCRQAGKSTTAAALAVHVAVTRPDSLVLLLSPTLRQSGELFRDKVMRIYKALGSPRAAVQESALTMGLSNGSRVVSLPGDEDTVRGYSRVSLLVIDEAAKVGDDLYRVVRPMLAVSGGRLLALSTPYGKRGWFYREWYGDGPWTRVRVTAEDCPRIPREFLLEERRALGQDWYAQEYLCEFTEAGHSPLYPPDWLDRAARLAASRPRNPKALRAIGVDTGEGVAETSMACVDEGGLLELQSRKTPDTSVIRGEVLAFARRWDVPAERVAFDRGGGGKQIADELRRDGFGVRTVAFGEAVVPEPRRGMATTEQRLSEREERYAYANRRAQMYGELRLLLDPSSPGFAIPAEYAELRRQLAPIPLTYDREGRLELLPKNARGDGGRPSLVALIGCSPDQADALVLAVHALRHKSTRPRAGAT